MTKKSQQKSIFEQREDNLKLWVGFWRANPHRFATEYLKVPLFFFQKILLYMMNITPRFMMIAARGLGKSWLIGLYAIIRCILYPGTKVVIASGVKNQARLIISEKIQDLYNRHSVIRAEIGPQNNIKTSVNDAQVTFLNGSKIFAVASTDNTRGVRGNILIADEFRMIDYEIVDKVLKPIINVERKPPFAVTNPKYKNYSEKNIEIYISSAWYKSHWSWESFKDFFNTMLRSIKEAFVITMPYQVSMLHGLLSRDTVNAIVNSNMFDQYSFMMEYEGLFVGETDKSFFNLNPINDSRTITKTFIPPTNEEFVDNKRLSKPKALTNMPRRSGEIRLVGLDVALMASTSHENDMAVFTAMRMIPGQNNTYKRHVVYMETIDGISTQELAIKFKRLFYDFEADYAILDSKGNGLGVYDACCSILNDEERDTEYEAWVSINDESLKERFKNNNGQPVLYTYQGHPRLNDEIARGLKSAFASGKLKIPVNHIQKHEELMKEDSGRFKSLSLEEQQREMYTFQQSSALVAELMLLEWKMNDSAQIKIIEPANGRKDRYSSLGYTNHRANEIEIELMQKEETHNYDEYVPTKISDWRRKR